MRFSARPLKTSLQTICKTEYHKLNLIPPDYRQGEYFCSEEKKGAVSKTNDAYNENLVSGHRDSGYFYTFVLDVKNSSPYDIKLIRGDMEVFNKNGDLLSTSSAEIRGNILRKSSEKYGIQLHTEKGENAREIWNTSLDELKIVFKINAVHFSDGKIKTYRNVKEIVIHEIK